MIIDIRTWPFVRMTIRFTFAGPRAWFCSTNGRTRSSFAANACSYPPAASSAASTYAPTSARLVAWPDAGDAA